MALVALITKSSFKYPFYLEIPSELEENLSQIILFYQVELMKSLLGEVEYQKFFDDLDVNGDPQTQKWIDFLDGSTYTVNGKTISWAGFKVMMVPFMWYYYKKDQLTISSTINEMQPVNENSNLVGAQNKFVEIYSKGIDQYGFDWQGLFTGTTNKYNVKDCRLFGDGHTDLDYNRRVNYRYPVFNKDIDQYKFTAYNFLLNRYLVDFPDWEFTQLNYINQFNI